uniref:Cytochrome b n=1 Tax=Unio tumidus TaxID=143298 RepID=A0A1Q1MMP6_9BIVA|nr:cytochrome b [Unio tumidus]AQM37814.1 cytochrome b [Unio tumidus]AQM37828.1 cytochrome b [Unio tumidus]
MKKPTRKYNLLISSVNSAIYDLPTPLNLSSLWNMGSLLGLCLAMQILSGIFLAIHYTPNTYFAFSTVVHITRDVNLGWLLRSMHATGASLFFVCVYMHIGRGIYYGSYLNTRMWLSGVVLLLSLMVTAFLGYVLPWGQMSYWGATVITNLLSVIPNFGNLAVEWVWGGFTVSNATLNRFFVFHFFFPFMILAITIIHLAFLHESGSNNPVGLSSNNNLIHFHPFYSLKDLIGFLIFLAITAFVTLFIPLLLSDPENFMQANPMSTPTHIQPEWYFLFAYAILRAIPNKMGGVIALLMSILVLTLMPFIHFNKMRGTNFYPSSQLLFWLLVASFMLLTWLGQMPTEMPLITLSQVLTLIYFSLIMLIPMAGTYWDALVFYDSNP